MRSALRSALKRANQTISDRIGYQVTRPRRTASALERELARIEAQYQIDLVLDVGAHTGGFAERRRQSGFLGRIVSFEPYSESFAGLSQAAASDAQWEAHQVALGSNDYQGILHLYGDDQQMNSLLPLSEHAQVFRPGLHAEGEAEVAVKRLDSIWPSLSGDSSRTLLKIDTQGSDLAVVEGAGELMQHFPALLTEVPVTPLYEGVANIESTIARLRDLGFELTGAFPIHRYGDGVRVIEFDCTFVRVR